MNTAPTTFRRTQVIGMPTVAFCDLAGRFLIRPEELLTLLADDFCADPPDALMVSLAPAVEQDWEQLLLPLGPTPAPLRPQ